MRLQCWGSPTSVTDILDFAEQILESRPNLKFAGLIGSPMSELILDILDFRWGRIVVVIDQNPEDTKNVLAHSVLARDFDT